MRALKAPGYVKNVNKHQITMTKGWKRRRGGMRDAMV
jgi:hypothetical protein